MKLERLISMIYMLLNNEVVSASALADKYGVSQRTIYRDIEAICAAGIPVVSYQGANGGYGIIDTYKMDRSLLGSYDVESLVTILSSLSNVFDDEQAMDTVRKLQTIRRDDSDPVLDMDIGSHRGFLTELRMLRTAILERNVVRFEYISWKSEKTIRLVEPASLKYRNGSWYLFGYCRERRGHREFKLSRMSGLEALSERFVRRLDAALEKPELEPGLFGTEEETELRDVVLRFEKEAVPRALDHFGRGDRSLREDGSLTVALKVANPARARWLLRVLLGFGDEVVVEEPPELREAVRSTLEKMLRRYS
ncbi:YafY family transcriptional regulator [Cohnella xylanilytica]|uniref:YafY family transcriptional regulator n=1 Tax=Cohnella xylanilytica TaxID=557555 RepID=A0A841U0H0_9BACL|nr:YafY family protein [Cohnella xylanilytica]MBB6693309.1 YafY family transcriptional regulator [Cohnella xylanilytica]